jgi:rifampicin phosphotransferase
MSCVSADPDHIFRWLDGGSCPVGDVGGKGASLSRLRALGAPVPLAAAIPAQVYRDFATSNRIPPTLDAADAFDLASIRARIIDAPLPAGFDAALTHAGHAYASHQAPAHVTVAVRSSAIAEDSAHHAFAGLHDTILNVEPGTGLEAAVRQCWASLWSDRAIAYRREHGLHNLPMDIAVVIQEMIHCDVSFVAFAVDPITGDDDAVLITATWGLGEAVVAGMVVPDLIRVGPCGEIREFRIGAKHQMVIPVDGGVRCVPVPRALQAHPAIDPVMAGEIAATVRALSAGLGFPADVEGGLLGSDLHIFQARPITTLPSSSS